MFSDQDIPQLVLKKLQGTISSDEESELEAWAAADPSNRALLKRLLDEAEIAAGTKAFDTLWGGNEGQARYHRMEEAVLARTRQAERKQGRRWLPYAAAFAILAMSTAVWLFRDSSTTESTTVADAQEILPGGNRATLTLIDGRTIELDEAQSGISMGRAITYTNGGEVLPLTGKLDPPDHSKYMRISTPRGGQYQITLSDGSKVWLNAESTLRYPYQFGNKERVVELEGEAYFEVTRDKEKPFRVISPRQGIEVLGTTFNLHAYADEPETSTTLVEGKVKINTSSPEGEAASLILLPGHQAITGDSPTRIESVDTDEFTAWKDGFFYFNGDSPKDAFAQLSRWYDIELVYRDASPNLQFYGMIERNKPLGSLLNILEKAGLEFEVMEQGGTHQLIIQNPKPK